MVRARLRLLCAAALLLAPAMQAAEAAQVLSPSAQSTRLAPLPERPALPPVAPSLAWEDAAAATLVSLPFTAFWSLLGALAVGGISQGRFPPELNGDMLAGAAMVAGGTSLGIGLINIRWGGTKKPAAEKAAP